MSAPHRGRGVAAVMHSVRERLRTASASVPTIAATTAPVVAPEPPSPPAANEAPRPRSDAPLPPLSAPSVGPARSPALLRLASRLRNVSAQAASNEGSDAWNPPAPSAPDVPNSRVAARAPHSVAVNADDADVEFAEEPHAARPSREAAMFFERQSIGVAADADMDANDDGEVADVEIDADDGAPPSRRSAVLASILRNRSANADSDEPSPERRADAARFAAGVASRAVGTATLAALRAACGASLARGRLFLPPPALWRARRAPVDVLEAESGIAGRLRGRQPRLRGVRARVDDVQSAAVFGVLPPFTSSSLEAETREQASPLLWLPAAFRGSSAGEVRVATLRRAGPPPLAALRNPHRRRYFWFVRHRVGVSAAAADAAVRRRFAAPSSESGSKVEGSSGGAWGVWGAHCPLVFVPGASIPFESGVAACELCACEAASPDVLRLLFVPPSSGGGFGAVAVHAVGFFDSPPPAAAAADVSILLRGVAARRRTALAACAAASTGGFLNFFGPRKFGLGQVKHFHVGGLAAHGRCREALVAMAWQAAETDADGFGAAFRAASAGRGGSDGSVESDGNTDAPVGADSAALLAALGPSGRARYPWLPPLLSLLSAAGPSPAPFAEVYSAAVPAALRRAHAAAGPALAWNVAAAVRRHRLSQGNTARRAGVLPGDIVVVPSFNGNGNGNGNGNSNGSPFPLLPFFAAVPCSAVEAKWELAAEDAADVAAAEAAFAASTAEAAASAHRALVAAADGACAAAAAAAASAPAGSVRVLRTAADAADFARAAGSAAAAEAAVVLPFGGRALGGNGGNGGNGGGSVDAAVAALALRSADRSGVLAAALATGGDGGLRPFSVVPLRAAFRVVPEAPSSLTAAAAAFDAPSTTVSAADSATIVLATDAALAAASADATGETAVGGPLGPRGHRLRDRLPSWAVNGVPTFIPGGGGAMTNAVALATRLPATSYASSFLREAVSIGVAEGAAVATAAGARERSRAHRWAAGEAAPPPTSPAVRGAGGVGATADPLFGWSPDNGDLLRRPQNLVHTMQSRARSPVEAPVPPPDDEWHQEEPTPGKGAARTK